MFADPKTVMQNDVCLVTALVERWRPETNTLSLHFRRDDCDLEDVYMLMGLPVVGEPIKIDGEVPAKKTWLLTWHDSELRREERESA